MNEKDNLLDQLQSIWGRLPNGTRDILNALIHPDVIEYTKRYVHVNDTASRCTKYKEPWNCAKEAEARYENIKYGWLGAGLEMDGWCSNCIKRVADE